MSPIENNVPIHILFCNLFLNISRGGKWWQNTLYAFSADVLLSEKRVLISTCRFTFYSYNFCMWKRQPLYHLFIIQEKPSVKKSANIYKFIHGIICSAVCVENGKGDNSADISADGRKPVASISARHIIYGSKSE